jgi:cbb3-type cytochrome oxidase maturation protein
MNIVILLIFSSVIAATIFLIAFLWAARSGQYDDVHTPAVRMLFEDQPVDKSVTEIHSNSQHGT